MTARIPPQAIEVEEVILGASLIERASADIVVSRVQTEWLYKTAHQHILKAIKQIYNRNQGNVDLITIEAELTNKNLLQECGGTTYLIDLTRTAGSSANINYHINIIYEKYLKRATIIEFNDRINDLYQGDSEAIYTISKASSFIDGLMETGDIHNGQSMIDALPGVLNDAETAMKNYEKGIKYTGIPTGLDIDDYTSGWQKGDLIIIAGRPSMGKTAFALNNAKYAAMDAPKDYQTGVAIFSLEMSTQQVVQRYLSMQSGINSQYIRRGKINMNELSNLSKNTATKLSNANILIDDTPSINLIELRTKLRHYVKKRGCGMAIVDYLQLMSSTGKQARSNREQDIAEISRGLKSIAKELSIPIIALSQLSRAVEQRGGLKQPILADLRESGSIEQDADLVIFLWRPEYYDIKEYNGNPTNGLAYALIAKQRNGPVGNVKLNFQSETGRFTKPAHSHQQNDPLMDKARNGQHYPPIPENQPF